MLKKNTATKKNQIALAILQQSKTKNGIVRKDINKLQKTVGTKPRQKVQIALAKASKKQNEVSH